ncbi:sulfate transporter family-domain-containing protein [Jimgerdemannia flammicorona]|uniref:Sulfate transporter family-domain-containing protein n=1 Tax=Jimgerdemannia flammicorona TaxID=994334 RepID=A0A433QIS5_9FUNG|nr:sulfate transporter family-domain-containing protein [Jimgerdemannia flammicorona]
MPLFTDVQWRSQPPNNGSRRPTLILDQQPLPFLPPPPPTPRYSIRAWPKKVTFTLSRWIPILEWLPNYRSKQGFLFDLVAGITISTIVIPQSMAYATLAPTVQLADLPPAFGLYTSLIPVVIYCVFGTSKHMSTGAFAVTSLLLGNAVTQLMTSLLTVAPSLPADNPPLPTDNTSFSAISLFLSNPYMFFTAPTTNTNPSTDPTYTPTFIALSLALTFLVGLVQLILGVFRLGSLVSDHLLPDPLIAGIYAAAAVHIVSVQIAPLLGIPDVPGVDSVLGLFRLWAHLATHIGESNVTTAALGVTAMLLMEGLRRWERKRMRAALKRAAKRLSWRAGDTRWRRTPVLNGYGGDVVGRKRLSRLMSIGNASLVSLREVEDHPCVENVEEGEASIAPNEVSIAPNEVSIAPNEVLIAPNEVPPSTVVDMFKDKVSMHFDEEGPVPAQANQQADFVAEEAAPAIISAEDLSKDVPEVSTTAATQATVAADTAAAMNSEFEGFFEEPEPDLDQILPPPTGIEAASVHIPFPDLLTILVLFTLVVWLFNLNVDIVGPTPAGIPPFQSPLAPLLDQSYLVSIDSASLTIYHLNPSIIVEMLPHALLIAVLTYVMSLAIARQFARTFHYSIRPNQELVALGVASTLGSCFSAYASSGSLSRSATLVQTGSRSQMASLVGVAAVAVTLLLLTPAAVGAIPACILAAIVVVTCRGLASRAKDGWRLGKEGRKGEAAVFWATLVGALALNLEWGVLIGSATAAVRLAWRAYRRHVQDREGRGRIPRWRGSEGEREVEVEWEEGEGWWWRVGAWVGSWCNGGGHGGRVGERWMRERVVYDEVDDGVDDDDEEVAVRIRGYA